MTTISERLRWPGAMAPLRPAGRSEPTSPREMLYLRGDLRRALGGRAGLEDVMALPGEVVREGPARRTLRLERGGRRYYLKTHTGVGWREIVKNLAYGRAPVLGARTEWRGVQHLDALGIDTLEVAGYGVSGRNPARLRSFIVTDEIADAVSLEEFCRLWGRRSRPTARQVRYKRWLIERVAAITRTLHESGANHRDFYLCHFLLQVGPSWDNPRPEHSRLYVIDLHRMQIRPHTPRRWAIKDLAGLYFSSHGFGFTRRDRYRFIRAYRARPLREALETDTSLWRRVCRRAAKFYRREARTPG